MGNFDPWGPISAPLYEGNNADLVETVIDYTGVAIPWPVSAGRDPHVTRIRAYRPLIRAAYSELPEVEKGRFAQIVAKRLMASSIGDEIKRYLSEGSATSVGLCRSKALLSPKMHWSANNSSQRARSMIPTSR
jgi:hypothetical protein